MLSQNGIQDDCALEVVEIIKHRNIKYVDLSCNKLGKIAAKAMATAINDTYHLVWLE